MLALDENNAAAKLLRAATLVRTSLELLPSGCSIALAQIRTSQVIVDDRVLRVLICERLDFFGRKISILRIFTLPQGQRDTG